MQKYFLKSQFYQDSKITSAKTLLQVRVELTTLAFLTRGKSALTDCATGAVDRIVNVFRPSIVYSGTRLAPIIENVH